MALNTEIESLDAGAPDIKYTGTEGPQDPRMASAPSGGAELYQVYQNALQSGQIPKGTTFEMFKELLQQSKARKQNSGIMASGPTGTYTQRRRAQMAGGGITQIGKPGGLVEPGISKYAWYDFIVDPVKDYVTEKAVPYLKEKAVDYLGDKAKDWLGIGEPPRGGGPDPIPEWTTPPYVPEPIRMPQGSPYQLNQPTPVQPVRKDVMPLSDEDWLAQRERTAELPIGRDYSFTTPTTTQPPRKDILPEFQQPSVPTSEQWIQDIFGGGEPPIPMPQGSPYQLSQPTTQPTIGPREMFEMAAKPQPTSTDVYQDKILRDLTKPQPTLTEELSTLEKLKSGASDVWDWTKEQFAPTDIGGQQVQWKIPMAIGAAAGLAQQKYIEDQPPFPMDETGIRFQTAKQAMADPTLRFKPEAQYANVAEGGRIGLAGGSTWREFLADKTVRPHPDAKDWRAVYYRWLDQQRNKAQGGRIGAQEGGLMNLGGMEKDYRQEGGFVPLGGEEKADDVPARLSKNEFVFTADAVRAAGGGDIDAGAEVMENLMGNLEAGGKISEDSQGLEGAQGMFANAQALEKRII